MEILTGALLGLSTLLFIGPVFFYLLKSTLEGSTRAGLAVAIGIIIGDIIYVFLVVKGMSALFASEENQKWLALAGGILLLAMGLNYVIKPQSKAVTNTKMKRHSLWWYGLKGFTLNFINPFVIGVWIFFLGVTEAKYDSESAILTSLFSALVVIFVTDILKVLFASRLKRFMNLNRLKIMYRVFGLLMILFGLRLVYNYLQAF